MTGTKRVFIDTSDFYSFTVGVSLNTITLNPMEYMALHTTGLVSGTQVLSLQGVALTEVNFASFDVIGNIGKYTVSPTTNAIMIGVDPLVITTQDLAIKYITGLLLSYNMISLSYYGDSELYTMQTRYSNNTLVGSTNPTTFAVIQSKISSYDDDINVNSIGYYEHIIRRALIAS